MQLRDAPEHAAFVLDRAQRLSAGTSAPSALAKREQARWDRALQSLPGLRLARRDAVGASAQRLLFDHSLSHDQAQALAVRLAALPEVAWAVPATREQRAQAAPNLPNDPYFAGFNQQWWLQRVQGSDGLPLDQRLRGVAGFETAWIQQTAGSSGARAAVAVLDSGVTPHPELSGRLLPGYDMVSDSVYANDGDGRDADPSDPGDWVDAADRTKDPARFGSCIDEPSSWHGTAIAGMLGGATDNGAGTAATNWRTPVLPVRVAGKCGAEVGDIVDGMRWAAGLDVCKRSDTAGNCVEMAPRNANPVKVVSISFGGTGDCAPYQSAIDELRRIGVVITAAAGNEWTTPTRPAKCPGVVGVVALNRDGFKTNYSNFGTELTASGIATVGGDDDDPTARWSALADSGLLAIGNTGSTVPAAADYFFYYGTSFSTPIAAGAVSLMLSVNPGLSYDQIVQGLRVSARPHVRSTLPGVQACSASNPGRCLCTTATCGAGILDVVQALIYARDPAAYVVPARSGEVIDAADLRVAAALGPDRPPNSSGGGAVSGGGGGGVAGGSWLAALALAALALARRRR
ncbi:MAG: S8 family serine peptidase [Aquincola sp.]|nr:S8 family serine peptidase [Aquincola sp.]